MGPQDGVSRPCSEELPGNIYLFPSPIVANEDQAASDFVRICARILYLIA